MTTNHRCRFLRSTRSFTTAFSFPSSSSSSSLFLSTTTTTTTTLSRRREHHHQQQQQQRPPTLFPLFHSLTTQQQQQQQQQHPKYSRPRSNLYYSTHLFYDEKIQPLQQRSLPLLSSSLSSSSSSQFPSRATSHRLYSSSTTPNEDDHVDTTTNHHFVDNNNDDDELIRQRTMDWIQRIVIGMNLCPFAETPWRNQQLYVSIVRARNNNNNKNDNDDDDDDDNDDGLDDDDRHHQHDADDNDENLHIYKAVLQHGLYHKTNPGTTLVVCPDCHPDDFHAYLQVLHVIEDDLLPNYHNLQDYIQIASFHPLYEFDGSGIDGIDNWTNRAPYPIFHILREQDVSKAVDKLAGVPVQQEHDDDDDHHHHHLYHDRAMTIWQRNVDLMEALQEKVGAHGVARYIRMTTTIPATTGQQQQQQQEQGESSVGDATSSSSSKDDDDDDNMTDECLKQRVEEVVKQFRRSKH